MSRSFQIFLLKNNEANFAAAATLARKTNDSGVGFFRSFILLSGIVRLPRRARLRIVHPGSMEGLHVPRFFLAIFGSLRRLRVLFGLLMLFSSPRTEDAARNLSLSGHCAMTTETEAMGFATHFRLEYGPQDQR